MNDVRLERLAGVYKFHIDEHDLTIRVDRLHDAKDATVAEISVYSTLPGMEESYFMPSSRINLGSALGRKGIAKELQESYNHIDWQETIKMICGTVLKYHRQGESVQETDDQESAAAQHLVEPLLIENQANLIFGSGGTCKSYLSALMCLLYHEEVNFGPLHTHQQGKALVLDYETSFKEFNHRIKLLKSGQNIDKNASIQYRFCHQSVMADIERIADIVVSRHIGLVVIDSYGMACGADAWSQQVARDYFMALRSLNCTTLTIDHVPKRDSTTPYGSVYKYNEARNIWQIESSQGTDEDKVQATLYHRKCNSGRLRHPLCFEFNFFPEGVIVHPLDYRDNAVFSANAPLQDQIAASLNDGPLTVKEIAEVIGAKEDSVRTKMHQTQHRFVKLPDRRWALKETTHVLEI